MSDYKILRQVITYTHLDVITQMIGLAQLPAYESAVRLLNKRQASVYVPNIVTPSLSIKSHVARRSRLGPQHRTKTQRTATSILITCGQQKQLYNISANIILPQFVTCINIQKVQLCEHLATYVSVYPKHVSFVCIIVIHMFHKIISLIQLQFNV